MTDRRRRWALVTVCMSMMVVALDNLILNVALPTLVRELHASTSELQWIVDSYTLVFAGLLLVGGNLGDRFGRAKMLRIGLTVFGVASAAAAFSTSTTALVACRGVMGIGAALITPTSGALVTNLYTDVRERGRALGVWSAFGGLGIALGPVLGGVLLSQFWWGSVFLVNVPIVAVTLVVGWWAIPESRNPEMARFDPVGVVLSVLGVSGLVWATIQAPTQGWGSTATLGSFAGAATMVVCFVVWELRCEHPMLELEFFRNARFSVGNLATAIANLAFAGTLFVLTQLLQSVFGYSPLEAGIRLIPLAAALITSGLLSPRIAEYIGTKRTVALGFGIFATSLVVLATTTRHTGYGSTLVAMVMFGLGFGFTLAPTTDAVLGAVPRQKAGLATGTLNMARWVSAALGVAVIGSLLVSGYRSRLAAHTSGLGLSGAERTTARESLGAALGVGRHLGGAAGRTLGDAARDAFIHGMHLGMSAGATISVLGAMLALRYLPARAHDAAHDASDASGPRPHAPLDLVVD